MTSSGLSRAGHEILRLHQAAGLKLDPRNGGPCWPHGTATPFRHGHRMNTKARGKLRAGQILACQEIA